MRDEPVLVDPAPDVGSPDLADALAARDPEAMGRALRSGWVVVPVRRVTDGPTEVRLFSTDDPDRPGWEVTLFSSVATLVAFLARDPHREFDFVRAASLTGFLERGRGVVARVVFDPAGPHPVAASLDDVLAVLAPQPGDPVIPTDQPRGFSAEDRVLDLDLPLGDDWFRIDLTDEAARKDRIAELVDRQLAGLNAGSTLRVQLLHWLRRMASAAAGGSGRETAFLLRRTEQAALALSVTRYWQTLGAGLRNASHLDTVADRLRDKLGPDDELIGATTPAARLLRHTRVVQSSADLRAERMPLLAIDYWLELPDGRGLCLVSFSTPHVDLRQVVGTLTDEIVLESSWVIAAPADAEAGQPLAEPLDAARDRSPAEAQR